MEAQEKNTAETEKNGKAHERSASYPALTLDEAIEFSTTIYKNFSANVFVKREEVARVMDVHANSISRDFGACAQFNLLDKSPEGYKVSSLLDRIVNPENSKDRKLAKLESFSSPKLYKELIEKFDGHFIPHELPNTLVKHHGITSKAAQDAAEIFLKSAQQAEALGDNRVLKYRDTVGATQKIQQFAEVYDVPKEEEKAQETSVQLLNKAGQPLNIPNQQNIKTIPIPLTKNKEAYFAYPTDMSANDVKLVESQLKVILMRIEFDNEENKSSADAQS